MPPPGHTHTRTHADGRTGRKHNAVASMDTGWATKASKCHHHHYYYYYYAAFNAPCVGHKDDKSQAREVMWIYR